MAMIVKMDCITQKMRSPAWKKMKQLRGVKCKYNDRLNQIKSYNKSVKKR